MSGLASTMLDIALEDAGPFELAYPHLTDSARLYVWRTQFLQLLDLWGACKSSRLSDRDLKERESDWEKHIVCIIFKA